MYIGDKNSLNKKCLGSQTNLLTWYTVIGTENKGSIPFQGSYIKCPIGVNRNISEYESED
jgi:hypothetical protein